MYFPTPCPVCGKPSVFSKKADRYLHEDGSANLPCWRKAPRGQATATRSGSDTLIDASDWFAEVE